MRTQTTRDIDRTIYVGLGLQTETALDRVVLRWTEEDKMVYRTQMNEFEDLFGRLDLDLDLLSRNRHGISKDMMKKIKI